MMNFYTAGLGEKLSEQKPIYIDCGHTKSANGTAITGAYLQFRLEEGETGKYCSIVTQINEDIDLDNIYDAAKAILMRLGVPAEYIKRRD